MFTKFDAPDYPTNEVSSKANKSEVEKWDKACCIAMYRINRHIKNNKVSFMNHVHLKKKQH